MMVECARKARILLRGRHTTNGDCTVCEVQSMSFLGSLETCSLENFEKIDVQTCYLDQISFLDTEHNYTTCNV